MGKRKAGGGKKQRSSEKTTRVRVHTLHNKRKAWSKHLAQHPNDTQGKKNITEKELKMLNYKKGDKENGFKNEAIQ